MRSRHAAIIAIGKIALLRAVLFGSLAASVSIAAAAENPEPAACARAYAIAHSFRAEVRGIEAKPEANGSHRLFAGLSAYIEGFAAMDFEARADALGKKFPDKFDPTTGVFGVKLSALDAARELLMESSAGALSALVSPDKVFSEQRKIFALARTCDLAYGFEPALGQAPAPERVVAMLRAKTEKQVEEKNKRLAALDDTECAIRFALAGSLFPPNSPDQQKMAQRLQLAASKAMTAQAGLTEERLTTLLQRGIQERGAKLKSGGYQAGELVEDVAACETRLGVPSAGFKLNAS